MSVRKFREFQSRHPKAAEPLKRWAEAIESSTWRNPGELKGMFGSADFVGEMTVFNVGGNKFRIVAFVHYRRQVLFLKHILTHADYDRGAWKQ